MPSPSQPIPPMLPDASPGQMAAVLGAMRRVAEVDGSLSEAASRALVSADRYLFGRFIPSGSIICRRCWQQPWTGANWLNMPCAS
jgi:hypothetical protein